ncbi:hypothetical protein B4U80_14139 [Leptotrombidium deliense]|uniref:TIL domain-containing protein n=1 Tax=Leptotrombidium deliense TaxID=299467 RepID=A0A443S1Y9_9ACAR|nr:hypothetical protein B4U80_14139 [Leptotrombidium deliense]
MMNVKLIILFVCLSLILQVVTSDDGCDDPNEHRQQCAPNKRCKTCGQTYCTLECRINGCVCKEGYRYSKNGICIPENVC